MIETTRFVPGLPAGHYAVQTADHEVEPAVKVAVVVLDLAIVGLHLSRLQSGQSYVDFGNYPASWNALVDALSSNLRHKTSLLQFFVTAFLLPEL